VCSIWRRPGSLARLARLQSRRSARITGLKRVPARGIADGDLTVSPASLDAIARYYATLVQGLSVQARDGASRADLEAVVTCAMAAWDTLVSADGY